MYPGNLPSLFLSAYLISHMYLPAYLPACPPPCLPACLPAYHPLPACLPAHLPACLPAYLPACLPACLPAFLVSLTLSHKQKMFQYAGTLKKDPPHHCTLLCLHLHLYICLSISSLPDGHRCKGQLTVRKIKTRYTAVDLPFLPYQCSPL